MALKEAVLLGLWVVNFSVKPNAIEEPRFKDIFSLSVKQASYQEINQVVLAADSL